MSASTSQSHLIRLVIVGTIIVAALLGGLVFVSIRATDAAEQAKTLKVILAQQCEATRTFYIKERQQWEGMVAVVQASERALPPDVVAGIKKSLDATFVLPDCEKLVER